MVKFFTLPPISVKYPYVLCNLNNFSSGYRYVRRYFRYIDAVIIDSGIEIFRDPENIEYPRDLEYRLVRAYRKIRQFVENVYITVPDYCDDYFSGNLWISDMSNIERTVNNVAYYTYRYPDINWLIPIQGWEKNPNSIFRCLKLYDLNNILDEYNYFGIANLCVEQNVKIIRKTIQNVYDVLGKKKQLHVFGLKIKALPYVSHMIYSFDSMAWTRPVDSSIKKYFPDRKNRSVKNGLRELYFIKYMNRIKTLL